MSEVEEVSTAAEVGVELCVVVVVGVVELRVVVVVMGVLDLRSKGSSARVSVKGPNTLTCARPAMCCGVYQGATPMKLAPALLIRE